MSERTKLSSEQLSRTNSLITASQQLLELAKSTDDMSIRVNSVLSAINVIREAIELLSPGWMNRSVREEDDEFFGDEKDKQVESEESKKDDADQDYGP